jgi:CheY-like chemotaxis protein
MTTNTGTILVVDDEKDLREVLQEFLSEKGYVVRCADSGRAALAVLDQEPIDLLLSDINMPGMKGFELIREATGRNPDLKTALITAYDVRDYIRLAKEHQVGNIIAKTNPFNFGEIEMLVRNIITEEVFGLHRYVGGEVHEVPIRSSDDIETAVREVVENMPDSVRGRRVRQSLGEILVNAVYYGARGERGEAKSEWTLDVVLEPHQEVTVSWAVDQEKAGVAVRDRSGSLSREEVLYWLERNMTRGPDGLSEGLFDEHGKGLFISRETIDRLIINIKRGSMTEVVMLAYREGLYTSYRPLWIHEL